MKLNTRAIKSNSGELTPGIYDFEVKHAEETVSKNGNEMIKLYLHIQDNSGQTHTVYDYLLGSNSFSLAHIKTFCEAVGLNESYEHGELLAFDCAGRRGKVHLILEKSNDEKYSDRLKAKEYLISDGITQNVSMVPDDDIPF